MNNRYYPIALNLKDRYALVVGGGKVAERKIKTLLSYGARVRVVSPDLTAQLKKFVKSHKIVWLKRKVKFSDIKKIDIVIAATSDESVNKQVSRWAKKRNILVNVVDSPDLCNFISPAVFSAPKSKAVIAVYTHGEDPVLSRDLKNFLKERWDEFLSFKDGSQAVIRMGVRPSTLAVKQAEEVQGYFKKESFETVPIYTKGDKDKITPFSSIEGSDFFTREIEEALINGRIDAAVHSAKDLEDVMPDELTIAAITASISPYECLVSYDGKRLAELPQGARIGTSSSKRKEALLRYRSDFVVCDVRGTIEERLNQLYKKKLDAVIMAHAALIRLGMEEKIAEIIPAEIIEPHPLQGCLAIQVRSGDERLIRLFSVINQGGVKDEN